jgi:hypothetical protein
VQQQQKHLPTHLPQINNLLESDVGIIIAAPLSTISRAMSAVAQEKGVSVRVIVVVQESLDAFENFARLQWGSLWDK